MKDCLKRHITYVQTAPTVAHLWNADLRERRRIKQEMARFEGETSRYKKYLELCLTIVMCRTRPGKIGVEYQALRQRLSDWESTYGTMTAPEWTGIHRCLHTHNIDHL